MVSNVAASNLKPGDIAVFWRNEELIAHRILKRLDTGNGLCFIEKGDATFRCGLVKSERILGKVMGVKGPNKEYYFNSSVGGLASRTLSIWFSVTAGIITGLSSSKNENSKKVETVLSKALFHASNLLVRCCCLVWRMSAFNILPGSDRTGIFSKNNPLENNLEKMTVSVRN